LDTATLKETALSKIDNNLISGRSFTYRDITQAPAVDQSDLYKIYTTLPLTKLFKDAYTAEDSADEGQMVGKALQIAMRGVLDKGTTSAVAWMWDNLERLWRKWLVSAVGEEEAGTEEAYFQGPMFFDAMKDAFGKES